MSVNFDASDNIEEIPVNYTENDQFITADSTLDDFVELHILPIQDKARSPSTQISTRDKLFNFILTASGTVGVDTFEIFYRTVIVPFLAAPGNIAVSTTTGLWFDNVPIIAQNFEVFQRFNDNGDFTYDTFLAGDETGGDNDNKLTVLTMRVKGEDDGSLNAPLPDLGTGYSFAKTVLRTVNGKRVYNTFILTPVPL